MEKKGRMRKKERKDEKKLTEIKKRYEVNWGKNGSKKKKKKK